MKKRLIVVVGCWMLSLAALAQSDSAHPRLTITGTNANQTILNWSLFPAADVYQIFSAPSLNLPFVQETGGTLAGDRWIKTNTSPSRFYQLRVSTLSSNDLLSAIVLNRLAYSPTPDELARLKIIGPQAFINEQLAPELIEETVSNSHTNIALIEAKFAAANEIVTMDHATIADFRAWHVLRAVGAKRQLLEILLQFWENHFVTEFSKSRSYFGNFYDDVALEERLAAQLEYLENQKWRAALLNPQCTFHDLLKISAESPAMIIYLDTVGSRGDGRRIPNENYARELLELFTFGVDNGYDQDDIVEISKCWTGWTVSKMDVSNAFNPLAAPVTGVISNTPGVFAFRYRQERHDTSAKTIFGGRTVPARFGPPWAGRNYQLNVPSRTGASGIQDGYQVIAHLANQPFTQEYMSVKFCRLFVHDDFEHGYDFTDPNLSPEGQLVKQCMLAWENSSPKGQIREVLRTIFDSELFRSHAAASQKVKTPLEFVVSAIRTLRTSTNGTFQAGTFSADTDGYNISGLTRNATAIPLNRMGGMELFSRSEPDGYPEHGAGWISAGTIAERLRFVQSMLIRIGQSGHNGGQGGVGNDAGSNTFGNPVALLKSKVPSANWSNPAAVADYFLGIIYPGEGRANLDLYRTAAINFLNTTHGSIPPQPSPFSSLSTTSTGYEDRVRGMVSMLMTLPQFQEQ